MRLLSIFLITSALSGLMVASSAAPMEWQGDAQSEQAKPGSSATVSTEAPDLPEDQSFASYLRITKDIKPPKAAHAPDPKYPDLPVDTDPHGLVVMLVGVSANGRVGPVHVLRSSAPVFEHSAVATVKKWKFKPAERAGQPVPVQLTVEMTFQK
jgi:periplasmic protein TonB